MTDTPQDIQFPNSTRRVPIANSEPGPAIGVGVHLGAPPIGNDGYGECFLVYANGVVYAWHDWREQSWIEQSPPPMKRASCIDDSEIMAWSDEREPAEAYYMQHLIDEGYADDLAEARAIMVRVP